ncbi:calcineurin-like metallo-phosphoesterase superfamily protein [Tasmannia lanceolata]|uniref:calcineurin-like metallo-phosphoesterase superfamily protein n=1 Tax=Tasmannia lanceolata TaxID=3420 RepID=UPI00406285E6
MERNAPRKMGFVLLLLFLCIPSATFSNLHEHQPIEEIKPNSRSVINVEGGPDSVIWVVQLSDLHFSVFNPERSLNFRKLVPPTLEMINPSLVFITGDLTDGKSKDLLTMKQDEEEWMEYNRVMEEVVERSGLDKKIFYDLRGNHDSFGVPVVGGSFDFFQKYSINGGLRRTGNVHSVTLQGGGSKHLFVGFDSTMDVGLRGPTNLFGHPTDEMLADLDSELAQWDSQTMESITKISFGHFPLSFSASSDSGKNLKDVFLKHSISAYLCGHLHTRFGKNLKRHHISGHHLDSLDEYFQLNMHHGTQGNNAGSGNCSNKIAPVKEFWEWEMGDWRKSRIMRILAIDAGHVSFVDINLILGAKKTIILPTFPLDSQVMQRISMQDNYICQSTNTSSYETIRALVFSELEIVSVMAKIYDSRPGSLSLIMEAIMKKKEENGTRGDLYVAPWNWKAFTDSSPDRFWLQVEAIDILGTPTFSQLRPFSINGFTAKLDWHWKEFLVMGCQWAALYRPMLWSLLVFLFFLLFIPKAFLICSKEHYSYKNLSVNFNVKSVKKWFCGIFWVLVELSRITSIWFTMLIYLLYLTFFPWLYGQVFTESGSMGYMNLNGWTLKYPARAVNKYIGVPDVMVVVLPHLCFVVLPAILATAALAAEKAAYRVHYLSLSGKKEDDYDIKSKRHGRYEFRSSFCYCWGRWIRKLLLVICLPILWKHWKNCRALTKAYEMNPFLHSPAYSLLIPLLLAYAIYKTKGS